MNILIQFYTLAYKSKKRKPKILFLIYFNETKVNSITKRNGTILVDNKHPFWWQTFDLTITEPQIKKELLILFPNLDAQNLSDISVAFNNFKAAPSLLLIEHTINLNSNVFRITSDIYNGNKRLVLSYKTRAVHPRRFWMELPNRRLDWDNIDLELIDLKTPRKKLVFVLAWNNIIP